MEEFLDGDGADAAAFRQWLLPHASFRGLWESLVYDEPIGDRLLSLVQTALHFAEQGVNPPTATPGLECS